MAEDGRVCSCVQRVFGVASWVDIIIMCTTVVCVGCAWGVCVCLCARADFRYINSDTFFNKNKLKMKKESLLGFGDFFFFFRLLVSPSPSSIPLRQPQLFLASASSTLNGGEMAYWVVHRTIWQSEWNKYVPTTRYYYRHKNKSVLRLV